MGKTKADYIADLQALDTEEKYPVKEDHNVEDIRIRIELIEGQKKVAELSEEITTLEEEKTALAEANEELNRKLLDAETNASNTTNELLVTLKGKGKVNVLHGVRHKGKPYTKEELAENEELVAELLKKGSSAVQLINE